MHLLSFNLIVVLISGCTTIQIRTVQFPTTYILKKMFDELQLKN